MRRAAVSQGWQVDQGEHLLPSCFGIAVSEAGLELLVLGCMLFTRSLTDMTTAQGSFINTWSYFVYEAVTFERRKDATAWLNHVFGSAVQNSGSLTATALTVTAAAVACWPALR
jgi:hypothetical protein